ncbi:Clustered mitochondria protein [Pyrenophora tritici-repentis]|nr:Clustered mitochondria protein [Pyrenophora tritici-repentis]KAI0591431.1 Clustered mitochondria protein [Pyrenophora tritici-repentis]KAI0611561.1 Clustered mitochondria protein [Pyrenophora tritici-repentis]KAI0627642.1 Clustered mitochondria protein [Pyrenophora tritici-repentis]KAI1542390.1 Clustered mitochondria protein [Pyrenophora tritici-repentis]
MATTNDASKSEVEKTPIEQNVNGQTEGADGADGEEGAVQPDNIFQVTIKLPHEPFEMPMTISSAEQVQDLRQSIIEMPHTFQYSCFHLEHEGKRINDYVELSEVQGLKADSVLTLVEDPYTEKEARLHVIRVRELIGAAGDRTDALHGIMAGLSLHDTVGHEQILKPKQDGPEQTPVTDYDFKAASVKTLLPPAPETAPKTIKSIAVSPWNPPPYHLRSKGHLLYLVVTTNENEQHHITAHVSGFYVNKSSNASFDPSPRQAPKAKHAHSLLTLLEELSPSFRTTFQELLEHNAKKELLTIFQLSNAIPANPWLVPAPTSALTPHQPDLARTQESYLISGVENTETLRDWNEEFQSTREMPKEAVHDRVFRERLTSKLFADYNDAATRGAMLVARGEIAPLNPTEAKDAQIFVYNNIFYSFGADGVGTFGAEGGDEAARVAVGKDVFGVRAVNNLDIQNLFTSGTVVVDYQGKRIVGQSIVPGIFKQRDPGEHQIDYGAVEGKEIVADDKSFVPLFEQLSKALRVKKHPVWDKDNVRHELEGSVETKGLIGTDGRRYALDLYRLTPLDISWIEAHWTEPTEDGESKPKDKDYPHRMATLRPELVESYYRIKLREYVKNELAKKKEAKEAKDAKEKEESSEESDESSEDEEESEEKPKAKKLTSAEKKAAKIAKKAEEDPEQERVDISGFSFALNPDVFSGQNPQSDEDKKEWAQDEAEVRAACEHLTAEVIPRLMQEIKEGDVGFPMDGQSLSSLLHKRGVNIRYLGKLAELADKPEPRLQALKRLVVQEMIARGFKHFANSKLRNVSAPFAAPAAAHLLNCLLGAEVSAKPVAECDNSLKAMYPDDDFSFEKLTPELLKKEVVDQVALRFRFDLGESWIEPGKELQMLREVSLKLGLQLESKQYAFTKEALASIRAASPTVTLAPQTFHADDILNIVPIIKEASPKSLLAEEALEAGRMSLAQDQKELGQELLLESLQLHEQIYGVLHPEVAKAYHTLSNLLFNLDDKVSALELAHKAVIVSERTLGVDHADTVLAYLNLGLFEHASGNTKAALTYLRHALELWKIIYGPGHPDCVTTISNAAVMLQSLPQYHESRLWFEAALAIHEELFDRKSISTANMLFQTAQAVAFDKDMRGGVNRMRESYNVFKEVLGPDHSTTKEAEGWLEQLIHSAVNQLKAAQLPSNAKGRVRMQLPATSSTAASSSQRGAVDQRKIEDLLKYIEGETQKTPSSKKKTQTNPRKRTH